MDQLVTSNTPKNGTVKNTNSDKPSMDRQIKKKKWTLKRIATYGGIGLFVVFVAYLEALISTTFALNERKALALRMDFIFRIVYPVVFLVVTLVFWTT